MITFWGDYILVLSGGHQMNYEKLTKKQVDPEYRMRIDVFDKPTICYGPITFGTNRKQIRPVKSTIRV